MIPALTEVLMFEEVPVYNFELIGPGTNPSHVQFSTLPHHSPCVHGIHLSDIKSRTPLRVLFLVPIGSHLHDMSRYAGKRVMLTAHYQEKNVLQSE